MPILEEVDDASIHINKHAEDSANLEVTEEWIRLSINTVVVLPLLVRQNVACS